MYSNATLDESRLIGQWNQVGAFGGVGCAPGMAEFTGSSDALTIAYTLCLSGQVVSDNGSFSRVGLGRYSAPGLPADLWVLWIDADAHTLVLGTPSGEFGFVLNRGAPLPPDRAKAVREILDWNGYDLSMLTLW